MVPHYTRESGAGGTTLHWREWSRWYHTTLERVEQVAPHYTGESGAGGTTLHWREWSRWYHTTLERVEQVVPHYQFVLQSLYRYTQYTHGKGMTYILLLICYSRCQDQTDQQSCKVHHGLLTGNTEIQKVRV